MCYEFSRKTRSLRSVVHGQGTGIREMEDPSSTLWRNRWIKNDSFNKATRGAPSLLLVLVCWSHTVRVGLVAELDSKYSGNEAQLPWEPHHLCYRQARSDTLKSPLITCLLFGKCFNARKAVFLPQQGVQEPARDLVQMQIWKEVQGGAQRSAL